MGLKGIYEALFYTNLNTGELIPWQGESYTYNADFTQVTLKLRDGVTWCDGEKFTADDVKYTLEMLRDNSPDLTLLRELQGVPQGRHGRRSADRAVINLNKPAPRLFKDNLALGHENHQVDPAQAHLGRARTRRPSRTSTPPRTGRAARVRTTSSSPTAQQQIADRHDKWWGIDDRVPEGPAGSRAPDPHPGRERRGDGPAAHRQPGSTRQPAPAGHLRRAPRPRTRSSQSWSRPGPRLGRPGRLRVQLRLQQHEGAVDRRQRPAWRSTTPSIGSRSATSATRAPTTRRSSPSRATWPQVEPGDDPGRSSTSTTAARRRRPRSTSTWARPASPRTPTASGRRTARS